MCRKRQLLLGQKELKKDTGWRRFASRYQSAAVSGERQSARSLARLPLAAPRSFLRPLISNHHAAKVAPYFSALSLHCLRCALRHEMEVNLRQSQWRLETTGSN